MTSTTTQTAILHILRDGRATHMEASAHGLSAECSDHVTLLRRVLLADFRTHCRSSSRASVTVNGVVVARGRFVDTGRELRLVAEAA